MYRFVVPVVNEVEKLAVNNEQDINKRQQMMRVPKCIETTEPIKWLGKFDHTSSKPPCCKCKCHNHANHHYDTCHSHWPQQKLKVCWFRFPKFVPHWSIHGIRRR